MKPELAPDLYGPLVERIAEAVVRRLKQEEAPRLLSPAEAAKYLGRSTRWIRTAVERGELEAVRVKGKARPRFDRAALDRWIEERER